MRRIYLVLILVLLIPIFSCHKEHNNPPANSGPFLTTVPIIGVTDTSAASGGTFNPAASAMVVNFKGVQWDTSEQFSNWWQWKTLMGTGTGNFTSRFAGLFPNTHYYVRAFAGTDSMHLFFGDTVQLTTTYTPGKYLVSTIAGTGMAGFANGNTSSASFNGPNGIAVDPAGNIYISDFGNSAIRKITPSGIVSSVAGQLPLLNDLVSDTAGNIYVAEGVYQIIKITASGQVSVFAGSGHAGHVDGTGTAASFNGPLTLAIDPAGNLYVGDGASFRKVTPAGVVSTLPNYFNGPSPCLAIAVDNHYNLYESDHQTLIKVDSSGNESFLAGSNKQGDVDGAGSAAAFGELIELRTDAAGNIYGADALNDKIRMISPAGVVTTIAGTGAAGALDGNSGVATFNGPYGLALDPAGNILVADDINNKIRKISPL